LGTRLVSADHNLQPTAPELLERIQAGDADAVDEMHTRYYTRLYRAVYVRLESAEDAADVTQETFLRALEHFEGLQLPENGSFFPWLYTIARNVITDMHRSGSRARIVSLDGRLAGEFRSLLETIPNGRPTPDKVLRTHEVQAIVRRALRALPEAQYTAIVYRYLGGLSLVDIGEEMHNSVPAVKSILHRGLENLKVKLTEWSASGKGTANDRKPRAKRDSRAAVELRR